MTSLTLYGLSSAASTIATAAQMTASSGGSSTTTRNTLIGQSTGFGEIAAEGTASAWQGLYSLLAPSGMGFLFDVTILEQQQINAGNWTPSIELNTSVGSVTADIYARVYLYYNGIFWPASSSLGPNYAVLAGQSITTTPTTYALPAMALPNLYLLAGYKLYCDVWLNITSNASGSNSAAIALTVSSSSQGVPSCQIVTPGYQALTQSQLQTLYTFGGFIIHNRQDLLLQEKSFDFPEVKETLFYIARAPGAKTTGVRVNEKKIPVSIKVVGASRADVDAKREALFQALSYQQQNLVLHAQDARYWVADALTAPVKYQPGKIISFQVAVTFLAQNPYPSAAYSLSSTDSGVASLVSGTTWQRTGITLWRQGSTTAYPQIVVTNNTQSNNTTLTTGLTNGTNYSSLTVAALPNTALAGDTYTLNDGAGHTQNVVLSAQSLAGSTTISVTSFTANFSYPGSGATTVQRVTTITQVTINDTTDSRAVTFANISLASGQSLTVITDRTVTNGQTGSIGGGSPLGFSGIWPEMDSPQSAWTIQAVCGSQPTIQTVWTWTPKLLS